MHHSRVLKVPVDEDGYYVLRCPASPSHKFKGAITEADIERCWARGHSWARSGEPPFRCPYCGRPASLQSLAPAIAKRLQQLVDELQRDVVSDTSDRLRRSLRQLNRTSGAIQFRTLVQDPPRAAAGFPVGWPLEEPTRVELECWKCHEAFAVYGRASYCWRCGLLDPCQSAQVWLEALGKRLDLLEQQGLPQEVREMAEDFGLAPAFCEDAYIYGLSAVEATLLALYRQAGGAVRKPHLQELVESQQLAVLALHTPYETVVEAQAVRNCLIHRAGIIDCDQDRGLPDAGARHGQRVLIEPADARAHLQRCAELIALVLERRHLLAQP